MKFKWVRWWLLVACLAVAAVPQLVIIGQALLNARKIRSMGSSAETVRAAGSAADYLVRATFSFDTLGSLALWTLELTLLLYVLSLAVLYVRFRTRSHSRV
jgi:hypothetical protein